MNPLKGTRRMYWLAGMALLVVGLLGSALILPSISDTPGADGPDVQLPKMQNVPSENAPKLKLGE